MATLHGWLFDAYPSANAMTVWLIDMDGRAHALEDSFAPAFYVRGPNSVLHDVCQLLHSRRAPVRLRRAERFDLFLDRSIEVLEISILKPGMLDHVFRQVSGAYPDLDYYDADINIPQRYILARDIFPLAYVAVEHEDGRIRSIETRDSPWAVDYSLPPLRVMTLQLAGELRNPDRGYRADLLVGIEDKQLRFPRRKSRELIHGVRYLLERCDPDVIVSAYGDNFLLPRLIELSRHYGVPLPLNRDPHKGILHKRAHSYFSYGRVIFRNEQHLLRGRWHLDRQNAFLANDYGTDGTLEIARLTGLPVQTVNRVSTGTGISAMQIATALRRGVLVPWKKSRPEDLKTGVDLITADKGGLVYQPIKGLHEHVAELDFSAMYPSIMVQFNISPETVGAPEGEPVPELGTRIRTDREGLIPETLAPLLEKRLRYKELVKSLPADDPSREAYARRYSAHKWLLVTCFGYLGYKNARFGRIEAHEAVTAYGREVLLQAKELVEANGFRVLHIYVDGMWISKPAALERPDYESLLEDIQGRTGLHINLEGVYRWIAFLPARGEPRWAVANRYFGAYEDKSVKVRGIEARRRDTPAFIKQTQLDMIDILAEGEDIRGFRSQVPEAAAYAIERLNLLRTGKVPLKKLVITNRLSRDPSEFTTRTVNALVSRQLANRGVQLSPGESLRYILVPGPEKGRPWELLDDKEGTVAAVPYDRAAYTELFLRAMESIFAAVGVDRATLDLWLLGNCGYWGPPGTLPPPGMEGRLPLLARESPRSRLRLFSRSGPAPAGAHQRQAA